MFKRFAAVASVAALVTLGGTTAAFASTSVIPFNHSVVVNANGTDYFQATSPVVNAPVNAGPANSVDDNFVVLASGPNSVHFALMGSNLCLADPGSGYGAVDGVVLRTCNGKQWQAFRVISQGNRLNALQSVATNQYVQDNGQFNGLTTNADNRNCAVGVPCPAGTVGQNAFNGNANQEWSFGHFFPNFREVTATENSSQVLSGINSSVTYTVDVTNHGNVPVSNLVVNENANVFATLSYGSGPAQSFTANATANVVTSGYNTVLSPHSSEGVPGVLNLATFKGQTITFTNSTGTETILMEVSSAGDHVTFSSTTVPSFSVGNINSVHAVVTETPSVHVNFDPHAHNVHVTPQQEVTNF